MLLVEITLYNSYVYRNHNYVHTVCTFDTDLRAMFPIYTKVNC